MSNKVTATITAENVEQPVTLVVDICVTVVNKLIVLLKRILNCDYDYQTGDMTFPLTKINEGEK